jgi:hypothetical protein
VKCERCGNPTDKTVFDGVINVPLCEDCLAEITRDPFEIDDSAGDRDRDHATWEQENPQERL